MTKSDIIIELKTQKIVVVVRGKTKEEGLKASIACIKGGIKAIEVAYKNIKEISFKDNYCRKDIGTLYVPVKY